MAAAVARCRRAGPLRVWVPGRLLRPPEQQVNPRAAASSPSSRGASTWYSYQRPFSVATWLPFEIKTAPAAPFWTAFWRGNQVATAPQLTDCRPDWQPGCQLPQGLTLQPFALARLRRQTPRRGQRIGHMCRWRACRSWPIRRTSERRTRSRIQPTCCW